MENFQEVISECGFMEIPYRGPKFTWARMYDAKLIAERIDRGPANKEWMERFAFSREQHLPAVTSDHLPFLLSISTQERVETCKKRRFRFENVDQAQGMQKSDKRYVATKNYDLLR